MADCWAPASRLKCQRRAAKSNELERNQEQALREKIDSILIPILGFGNYTAQVDIQLDFSAAEQTRKRFDPNTPQREANTP